MASKLGLVISFIFLSMFFLLSIDVISIQYHYSDLDNQSIVIGYEIAKVESISDEFISSIEDKHHVIVASVSNRTPEFGDVIEYVILREYQPLIVSKEKMEIKIQRSVIVGYY